MDPSTPASGRNDSRRDWDLYSKAAVAAGIGGILAHLGVSLDPASLQTESVELPAGTHRADLVFTGAGGVVVHVEIQQRPDPGMGLRMAGYAVRIAASKQFQRVMTDLVQIVVQLDGPPMPTSYRLGRLSNDVLLLHVPSTPPEVFLDTPSLAPFALSGGDPALVGPVIDRIATLDQDMRASAAILAVFLAPGLRVNLIEQLRRADMIDTREKVAADLRDTEIGRMWVQQGLERGLEQGERAGIELAVTDVLTARFPDVDPVRIQRTAVRLVEAEHNHAARAAMTLGTLDA